MIDAFVKHWEYKKQDLREKYLSESPDSYRSIVEDVVKILEDGGMDENGYTPDSSRIQCIDHGDYQGTLVFVIAATGYQPSTYWYARIAYGSCSGCDTFEHINDCIGDKEKQVDAFMTLALHVVQAIKEMDGDIT